MVHCPIFMVHLALKDQSGLLRHVHVVPIRGDGQSS